MDNQQLITYSEMSTKQEILDRLGLKSFNDFQQKNIKLQTDKGHIYVVTSPDGTQYVGQSNCFYFRNSDKTYRNAGYMRRWKSHITRANSVKVGKDCVYLNNAIKLHGPENFQIFVIEETFIKKLNDREQFWIKRLNTVAPNGYNLNTGGSQGKRHSEVSLKKMSEAKIGKKRSEESIAKLKVSLAGKLNVRKARKREEDKDLPMYIASFHMEKKNSHGYCVNGHPTLKSKAFTSKLLPMEEKLKLAINYLNSASDSEGADVSKLENSFENMNLE